MNRMRTARLAGIAVLAAGLASAVALPAAAAPAAAPTGMLAAMQRDLGLSTDAALARINQENQANAIAPALTSKLAGSFAGTWFDSASGRLVVATTDASQVGMIQSSGATARLVQRTTAQLDALKASLDQGITSAPKSVTSWGVDTMTNSVVASVVNSDAAGVAWATSHG